MKWEPDLSVMIRDREELNRKLVFAEGYGMGDVKIGQMTGEYPNASAFDFARLEMRVMALILQELGATPAEGPIPGLWNVPGYPELTTNQLLDLMGKHCAR